MAKNFFEDMSKVKRGERRTSGRPSMDRMRVSSLSQPRREEENKKEEYSGENKADRVEKSGYPGIVSYKKKSGSRYGLWVLAATALVFLFFAVSLLFSKAEVTVTPETKSLSLNGSFSASKDKSAGGISFDLVSLSGEENKTIEGSEEKQVSVPAEGRVVIYNAYSSSVQTLDINTRLLGSNGKIYKTDRKISVPGRKADGTPGSMEVGIQAAEAGADYNSPPLDFKILGFKGSPKYEKFYGRSKGEIAGGFRGVTAVVSDTEKAAALLEMKNALKTKLLEKAAGQIPQGFVFWKDAAFLSDIQEDMKPAEKKGAVVYALKGTLYGFLFPEEKITAAIIKKTMPDYDGSSAYIANLRSLKFTLLNAENINFAAVGGIDFSLSGTPLLAYKFDSNKLLSDVLGKKKSDFRAIMAKYPHVASADLSVQPIWRQTFPERAEDITIKVHYPPVD